MAKRVTGDAFRETACSTAAFSDVLAGMQTANTIPRWRSDIYGPSAMFASLSRANMRGARFRGEGSLPVYHQSRDKCVVAVSYW